MIVPILKGGLGNQMFQIANAYAYAKRHGFEWGINYSLSFCPNQGNTATKYRETLFKELPVTDYVPPMKYAEPTFAYSEIPKKDNILLDGFFQSEKYFKDVVDEVKNLFNFSGCQIIVKNFIQQFSKPLLGIHIRRGDYKKFACHHGIQGVDYYVRAANLFQEEHQSIICTDDLASVQSEMNFSKAKPSPFTEEMLDLYLLSQCQNIIMCNSSFSWWGAFLGVKKDKVVAPKNWFGPRGPQDFQDVYREDWICL